MTKENKRNILCALGTRPEVIKMSPVIALLQKEKTFSLEILATAQHREMLDQTLEVFSIKPDFDLDIMGNDQTLTGLMAKLAQPLENILDKKKPDLVLVQGDTTTAFLTSLICFYKKIPVGHIEAGLRTHHRESPFPEEMHRALIGRLAALHFCPTQTAKDNLLKEGIPEKHLFITGNTVIDALYWALERPQNLDESLSFDKKLVLVTAHRRETFGKGIEQICEAVLDLATRNEGIQILFSVHPNPHVRLTVEKMLGHHPRILLRDPLKYDLFVHLMKRSYLILSDSGGIQEEVSCLKVPTLIMRESTERPEVVQMGIAKVIGMQKEEILSAAELLLHNSSAYQSMHENEGSPFGDGTASHKILAAIKAFCWA